MTLYRQIAILVTFVFAILLVTILMVSFNIVRDSAKKELYENAQNSVSSLSISIGNTDSSIGAIQTLINASFDNGNYEKISYIDMDGKVAYERTKEAKFSDTPKWFEDLASFEVPPAKAKLSSGWQVIGTLEILNDRSVTYHQLYNIMTGMITYLAIACLIFLVLLAFVFHIILRPLLQIQKQAEAVMNDEFVIQENNSWTKEFVIVINSINAMVRKFESIFKTASNTLCENKELLYTDSVMKIGNRRYFILKATEYLTEENDKNFGTTFIISIRRTDVLNQTLGYKNTDTLLFNFAQFINEEIKDINDSLVCRVNGTELIIMLPKKNMDEVTPIIQNIIKYFDIKLEENNLVDSEFGLDVGVCEFEAKHNVSELLSLVDYALAQAKLLPHGEYYKLSNSKMVITKEKWREIILDGFKNDKFEIMYRKVIDSITKDKKHNVVSFALNSNEESYFYGTLIAPVVELGMVKDVYLFIIKKALLERNNQENIPLSIQISSQFMEEEDTFNKLKAFFKEHKKDIHRKVVFEIPESVIVKHYETSVQYIKLFKEFGFEFSINNFMAISDDYEYFKELKPKFVKADKEYILDAQQNINVLKIVLDSLGIDLIATGVNQMQEVEKLNKKGISNIAGIVVDKL